MRITRRCTGWRFRDAPVPPVSFVVGRPKGVVAGQVGPHEELNVMARKENDQHASTVGSMKGDFIAPPEVEEQDERADALPTQEEFWRPPV